MTATNVSDELTRPIIGIENRTAQEVFDIMADRIRGKLAVLSPPLPSTTERLCRDIFTEITAKAQPLCEDTSDAEKITGYRLPVGPLHRAAGKLNFQMFDGERHLAQAVARIHELEGRKPGHGWTLSDAARREIEETQSANLHNAANMPPHALGAAPLPSTGVLRKALEPFARIAADRCLADHEDSYAPRPSRGRPNMADYRRALAALSALPLDGGDAK
jgi:hypothetical protein